MKGEIKIKRLTKQFLSLLMVVTLLMSGSGSVFAAAVNQENIKQRQIEALTQEKERILDDIMEQLKAQGAESHYFIYEGIINEKFENMTNSINSSLQADRRYYAPNGGTAKYNRVADVIEMYYNKTQTERLKDETQKWSTVGTINAAWIVAQLGEKILKYTIPSPVSSAMLALDGMVLLNTLKNSQGWTQINQGSRCALYIQSTYQMQTTVVLTQWVQTPYITISSNATNVSVKVF